MPLRVVTCAVILLAASSLFAKAPQIAQPAAEGCVVTRQVGCGSAVMGRLASGDCTLSNGYYYDLIEIDGVDATNQRQAEVILRPLSDSYSSIGLYVDAPPGNGINEPGVTGGKFGSLTFPLTPGAWWVGVAGGSLLSSGNYVLHINCRSGPQLPGCMYQELACNQTGEWYLDASSCSFSSGTRVYSGWWIWGKKGDRLKFEMISYSFSPLFSIYEYSEPLKTSTADGSYRATMSYAVPRDGWYYLATTSTKGGQGGRYTIKMECANSGCLFPYFTSPIADATATGDGPVVVTAPVNHYGGGGLTVTLYNMDDGFVTPQSFPSPVVTIPPVQRPTRFQLRAENDCGISLSNIFSVLPEHTSKRRAVRK